MLTVVVCPKSRVIAGWVLFRAETLPDALSYMKAMAGYSEKSCTLGVMIDSGVLNIEVISALIAGLIISYPFFPLYIEKIKKAAEQENRVIQVCCLSGHYLLMGSLFLVSSMYIAAGTYNPFIYFRF